jgi:hypothetical protein
MTIKICRKDKKNFFFISMILSISFLIISCGNGDSAPEEVYVIQTNTACTKDLNDILDRDITSSLTCVQNSLESFAESVKLEKPDYIQRAELTQFVEQYFPDDFDAAKDLLKLLFDLNSLLFNDPKDHLSLNNIPNIFKLASIVNNDGRELNNIFSDLDKTNYWTKRERIFGATQRLSGSLSTIISPYLRSQRDLNIIEFITQIKSALDLNNDSIDINLITSGLFIKKAILGGERNNISINQFVDLLERSPGLLTLGLDALYANEQTFSNKTNQFYFYYDIVKELKDHLWNFTNSNEIIFDHSDISAILEKVFENENYDLPLIEESIQNLKVKILKGSGTLYNYHELSKAIELGIEFTGLLYFSEVTYKHYSGILSSKNKVTTIKKPYLNAYNVLPQKNITKYWKQFEHIALSYRYFGDENGSIPYSPRYKRSQDGFTNLMMIKWGITKIIDMYGVKNPKTRKLIMGQDELNKIMQDAKGILKDFIYWPADYDGFLSETITNSDLFQYQSNGDELANTDELSEYLATVLHSFDLSDKTHKIIAKSCPIINEEDQSFTIKCFRDYFYPTFFEKLPNKMFYSKLYDYRNQAGKAEIKQYFKNIESYARVIAKDDIPITSEEITRLIVIVSSIEAIYIKYDTNKNNRLERRELDNAFHLFKGLIRSVADLENPDSKLYHSIFLYIIKEMKEPSTAQLLWFHVFGSKKNITSTRFNISAALSAFLQ